MVVVVVVCALFSFTESEARTEIVCLRTKRVPESTAILSEEAAGQVYKQTNKFVYLEGNVNYNADLSIGVDRRIGNACCSFQKYTLKLYNRPSTPLELKIRMLRAEVPRHAESTRVRLRQAAPSPPELPNSLHWLAKKQSH